MLMDKEIAALFWLMEQPEITIYSAESVAAIFKRFEDKRQAEKDEAARIEREVQDYMKFLAKEDIDDEDTL